MKTHRFPTSAFLLLGVMLAFTFASCSRSLTDLGYETKTSPNIDDFLFNTTETPPPYRPFYVSNSFKYDYYTYVADEDIQNIFNAYVSLRLKVLHKFYSEISTDHFYQKTFDKEYATLCSPGIVDAVNNYAKQNPNSAIGGWQILKPTLGLDAPNAEYTIAYEGNDLFSVKPAGDSVGVTLRIELTPDKMRPVIVGVINPAFNVSVFQTIFAYTGKKKYPQPFPVGYRVGKGYKYPLPFSYNATKSYARSEDYSRDLAKTIHKTINGKKLSCITEASFHFFFAGINTARWQLLNSLVAELHDKDFNKQQFTRKHSTMLHLDVAKAIDAASKSESTDKFGKWEAFYVGGTFHDIAYNGNNWYRITSMDNNRKTIYVQMVVSKDKNRTPIITGLSNDDMAINVGADFNTRRLPTKSWWRR